MKIAQQGNCCKLSGRLTEKEVKALWSQRQTLLPTNITEVDLKELSYTDSAGMAFLLELVSQFNGKLQLKSPSEQVSKLIRLYDLNTFITDDKTR